MNRIRKWIAKQIWMVTGKVELDYYINRMLSGKKLSKWELYVVHELSIRERAYDRT